MEIGFKKNKESVLLMPTSHVHSSKPGTSVLDLEKELANCSRAESPVTKHEDYLLPKTYWL
jgi:hypothetical protein